MTRVEVFAGVCGHSAVIEVSKVDDTHVQVVIRSECDQITDMNPDLQNLQWKGKGHEVFKRMTESAVYQSAGRHIRHSACPVPAAIGTPGAANSCLSTDPVPQVDDVRHDPPVPAPGAPVRVTSKRTPAAV